MKEYETIRNELIKRHDVLSERLHRITQDRRRAKTADFEDQATERENDAVLEALDGTMRSEIKQIEATLKRIENKKYDVCSVCGKTINIKRLKALPYTDVCVTCAEVETV